MATAIDKLTSAIIEAARLRQRKGHNDTCSMMLATSYDCDCGYIALRKALSDLDASAEAERHYGADMLPEVPLDSIGE